MFKFLSIFKRNATEQLTDNHFDFIETPTLERDIEDDMLSSTSEGSKPTIPLLKPLTITTPSPEEIALQEQADQVRISNISDQVSRFAK